MTDTSTDRRHRASTKRHSDSVMTRVKELRETGYQCKRIAELVGIPVGSVYTMLNWKRVDRASTARKRREIAERAAADRAATSIARPAAVTAPQFTPEWYEQNHASFVKGMRAGYPGATEYSSCNPFVSGGA